MGKISEVLGKVGDRAFGTPKEREERRQTEQKARKREREEEDKAYYQERLKGARRRGRARARQPSGTSKILNIMGSFSEAWDPFSKPKPKTKPKGKTVTIRVVQGKAKAEKHSPPRRKKEWWEDI